MNKFIGYCNKVIEYSFYLLFFLIPLYFTNNTSELYELNKMWISWAITIVITVTWIAKSIAQKRFTLQRTPLDIPILLFLLSQFISTVFSLDRHVSFWGYYSRFNGGFLSLFSYALLFYAFVSNYKDIARQNDDNDAKFTLPVRLMLFGAGLLIFPIAIAIASPPVNQPDAAHPTFLLLSMITAFFLFALSFAPAFFKRLLALTLTSGLIVALWGIPSHFGKDPTCYLFRGELNVNCWTEAFYPTVRAFSTLGQPAWLAAYACVVIFLALGYWLMQKHGKNKVDETLSSAKDFLSLHSLSLLGLTSLLYLSLLYANTRAGFMAFWLSFLAFWSIHPLKNLLGAKRLLYLSVVAINILSASFFLWKEYFLLFWVISIAAFLTVRILFSRILFKALIISTILLALITLFSDSTFGRLRMLSPFDQISSTPAKTQTTQAPSASPAAEGFGGTDSGQIRLIVWQGALDIWKANPLFGTGVETFAFAYYKHRPAAHNMTSEWDYLYNKAHNEYLNYLATTGIIGLGTYLFMIGFFLFLCAKWFFSEVAKREHAVSEIAIISSLLAAYVSILVTNFFGFSVVIINIFLFLIPAFVFVIMDKLHPDRVFVFPMNESTHKTLTGGQWFGISTVVVIGLYLSFLLYIYRKADISYALGNNLDNIQEYQQAYPLLQEAVSLRPGEPIFKDEFALNNATLATLMLLQENSSQSGQLQQQASQLASQAIQLGDEVITKYPNNIVFWKNRVRIFYTLSQVDPKYLDPAIQAMQQVNVLSPTDAKVLYNLGVMYRNTAKLDEARTTLEKAITLKPNYRDAYYALGLTLHDLALDQSGRVTDTNLQQEAEEKLNYILEKLDPNDNEVRQLLRSWQ